MESIDATCVICFLGYNGKERRPLVLPCSHSFCQACLEKLAAEDKKKCPNCREAWINYEVKGLLCCHQLVPNVGKNLEKDSDQCQEHKQSITTWCNTCKVSTCLKCLRVKHKTCNWVLMEEKYEEMVAKLNKLVTENGETFKSLDDFTKKLRNDCDKLADWRSKAQNELDNPLPLGKENGTAATIPVGKVHQKTLALVEIERSEPTNQFTRLLHDLSKTFQETIDGKPETFIKKFKAVKRTSSKSETVPFEFNFGFGAENSSPIYTTNSTTAVDVSSASSVAKSNIFTGVDFGAISPTNAKLKKDPAFVSGGKWIIRNDAEVAAACQVLRDPLLKPSDVSIVACDVTNNEQFEELLSLIAKRACSVSFKSLYTYWKSSPESEVTDAPRTQSLSCSRILSLLNPTQTFIRQFRCSLLEFWGFLDVDCVKLLPKTLKSIGLVLAVERDMDVLKELIKVDYGKWFWDNKWTYLNTLQIAVSKTFRPEWWNMHETSRLQLGSSFGGPHVPDLSKFRTVLRFSLHFPRLVTEHDLDWMKLMLDKIKDSHMEIGSLTDVFLPGLLISHTKVYDVLKSCGLDTDLSLLAVHLPIDAKNIFSMQTKAEMGNSTFMWDLAKL